MMTFGFSSDFMEVAVSPFLVSFGGGAGGGDVEASFSETLFLVLLSADVELLTASIEKVFVDLTCVLGSRWAKSFVKGTG